MITIISQPATDRLMAAYRPCISKVDFSNNVVPFYFNITVDPTYLEAKFIVQDDAIFLTPGWTTVTFANAPGLNGTYTISVFGFLGPYPKYVTIGVVGGLTPGNYPNATITLNSTLVENLDLYGPPKIVYCDVYIDGTYYKTINKTAPISETLTDARFEFDIQDALQEYLTKITPTNGGAVIINDVLHSVYCKYRSSSFDADGFLIPDPTVPIQATGKQPAVAGTGTQGNTFFAINAALQHPDNQELSTHLDSFKTGTWAAGMYPLTHRPNKYKVCRQDSDYFPAINVGNTINCLRLNYRLRNTSIFQTIDNCPPPITGSTLIWRWKKDLDAGLSVDLNGHIDGSFSLIDWGDGTTGTTLTHTYADIGDYTVTVYNSTSTIFKFADGTGSPMWNISEVIQLIPTIVEIIVSQSLATIDALETLPTMTALTALTKLIIVSNQFNAFPDLSANTALTFIQFSYTALPSTAIDLSANTALEQIVLNIPNMTNFTGSLANCKYFEAIACQLPVADVNTILVALDANGIVYVPAGFGVSCYLYNQTPAAPPSGAGATAKANLLTKGWTVNTD